MKRMPLIFSFLSLLVLCLSCAFWGTRMFAARPGTAALSVLQDNVVSVPGQWGNLFGASPTMQDQTNNYQLKGVVVAPAAQDSAAIISIDGKTAQTLHVNQELTSGVILSEVHETYIVIKEEGVEKRIGLTIVAAPQIAAQADVNDSGNSVQKSFSYAARQRRAAIPIPIVESPVAETPQQVSRPEQRYNGSELPTASYPALKTQ